MIRHWKITQWVGVAFLAAMIALFVAGWYVAAIGVLIVLLGTAVVLIEELPDQESNPTKPRG